MTRSWLLLAVPGVIFFSILLIVLFRTLFQLELFSVFHKGAFVEGQTVTFPAQGSYTVWIEVPSFNLKTTPLTGLKFSVLDSATRRPVPDRGTFPLRVSKSFSRRRWAWRTFDIPHAGTYALQINGMNPGRDYSEFSVAVGPAATAGAVLGMVGRILGLIVSMFGLIGSILVLVFVGGGSKTATPDAPPTASRVRERSPGPGTTASGRQLAEPEATTGWKEVHWDAQSMAFRIPPDWTQRAASDTEIDWRSPDADQAYVTIRITPYPLDVPQDQILMALLLSARSQAQASVIDGFAVREIHGVTGVLSIRTSRQGTFEEALWTAVVGEGADRWSIDVDAGAFDGNFERLEPRLAAVLASLSLTTHPAR